MGLDVYSGCLVRYYSRNWLTSVQQFGIANGINVNIVRANDGETAPVEDIITGVTQWRSAVIQGLEGHIDPQQLWNEDNDVTPYYTAKPDWCAYEALQLFFAAKYLGERVPETIPKDFNIFDHPIYKRFMKTKQSRYSLFECEWWLPFSESLIFPARLPTGKADKQTILSWEHDEGYPDDAYIKDGKIEMVQRSDEYNTESLAKFAFSIFWQAVKHSRKHGTMIILDY